jgi:hypothetical protein
VRRVFPPPIFGARNCFDGPLKSAIHQRAEKRSGKKKGIQKMATFTSKKLNAFQAERAPQIISDKGIQNSIDELIRSGTLPMCKKFGRNAGVGLIQYTQQHFEGEDFSEDIRFDLATDQYKFIRKYKNGNRESLRVDGTLQDISDARKVENAALEHEAYEAANPVEPSEKQKAVTEWLNGCKFGLKVRAYLDILPDVHGRRFVQIIWRYFDALFGKAAYAPDKINSAFVEAWDSGELDGYMHEADRLAREAQQAIIDGSAPSAPVPATPFQNLEPTPDPIERREADKENRNKPLAELRREALFSKKRVQTAPSTGTILR